MADEVCMECGQPAKNIHIDKWGKNVNCGNPECKAAIAARIEHGVRNGLHAPR